jgi:hypothetical protein
MEFFSGVEWKTNEVLVVGKLDFAVNFVTFSPKNVLEGRISYRSHTAVSVHCNTGSLSKYISSLFGYSHARRMPDLITSNRGGMPIIQPAIGVMHANFSAIELLRDGHHNRKRPPAKRIAQSHHSYRCDHKRQGSTPS